MQIILRPAKSRRLDQDFEEEKILIKHTTVGFVYLH